MLNNPSLAERYPARVAAAYEDAEAARRAAEDLLRNTGLTRNRIRIVDPHNPSVGSMSEPEKRDIWRSAVRTHLLFAGIGLSTGLAIAATMLKAGLTAALSQPVMVLVALAAFGSVVGLLVAGLVLARPHRARLSRLALEAAHAENWLVVASASNQAERDRARDALARRTSQRAQSL